MQRFMACSRLDRGEAESIVQWKLDHYAGLYGEGKLTLARAAREAGVPFGR